MCCRWFCHVDDDNYLNVGSLLKLLSQYSHKQDVYVGRPSLERPIEATERLGTAEMVNWTHPFLKYHYCCMVFHLFGDAGLRLSRLHNCSVWLQHRHSQLYMCVCLCAEAGAFLVRHRRSRVLSQPRPRSQDETLGEVDPHFKKNMWCLCFFFYSCFSFIITSPLPLCLCSAGTFMVTAEHIRLPDDCTVGYIVEALLGVSLIRSALFHSHLENLGLVSNVHNQVHKHKLTQTCWIQQCSN